MNFLKRGRHTITPPPKHGQPPCCGAQRSPSPSWCSPLWRLERPRPPSTNSLLPRTTRHWALGPSELWAAIRDAKDRPAPVCPGAQLSFEAYHPSAFETLWAEHSNETAWAADPCRKLREPHQNAAMQAWLNLSIPLYWPNSGIRPTGHEAQAVQEAVTSGAVLSHAVFRDVETGERVITALEPLAGICETPARFARTGRSSPIVRTCRATSS